MTEDEIRSDFEAWAADDPHKMDISRYAFNAHIGWPGQYIDNRTQAEWIAYRDRQEVAMHSKDHGDIDAMRFKEGQELASVVLSDDVSITAGDNCDKITVSMETGQMACVPWFVIWKNGKVINKWNAALCQGVILKHDE